VTVNGSGLDQPLTLASDACVDFTPVNVPPRVSSATVAHFDCTVRAVGPNRTLSVTDSTAGTVLSQTVYDVPTPQVTFTLSNGAGGGGDVVITLAPTERPITVDNFLAYVASGFYVGTPLHRYGKQLNGDPFVLQGGGYIGPVGPSEPAPVLKTTRPPIVLELDPPISNVRWTVAMARTQVLNSATSQFFFNLGNNLLLDAGTPSGGYAVFGEITGGRDVIEAIQAAPCSLWPAFFGPQSLDCVPVPNFTITAATQTR
jgi:cyclophilin family peptidyl-prolyl cis-trans isomerase